MSETWSVEASNVDVAVMALRIWGQYPTIPIVNYTSDEQSKFMNLLGATEETTEVVGEFIKNNRGALREAINNLTDNRAKPTN